MLARPLTYVMVVLAVRRSLDLEPTNQVARRAAAMCERCIELEEKINVYRQLSTWVIDSETRRGIESLVQKYRVDKKELHPPRERAHRPDADDFGLRPYPPEAL